MKNNTETAVVLLVLLFLCLALGAFAVEIAQPELVMVDGDQAFVYPEGDVFLMALEQGAFEVEGTVRDGCYALYPKGIFEEHAKAKWTGESCKGGK